MKLKKLISLFFALIMALGMFASCGKDEYKGPQITVTLTVYDENGVRIVHVEEAQIREEAPDITTVLTQAAEGAGFFKVGFSSSTGELNEVTNNKTGRSKKTKVGSTYFEFYVNLKVDDPKNPEYMLELFDKNAAPSFEQIKEMKFKDGDKIIVKFSKVEADPDETTEEESETAPESSNS